MSNNTRAAGAAPSSQSIAFDFGGGTVDDAANNNAPPVFRFDSNNNNSNDDSADMSNNNAPSRPSTNHNSPTETTPNEPPRKCASCGKTENDEGIKLKNCTACHLVRYCGVECQREHRPKHKKACKKRAAELRCKTSNAVIVGGGGGGQLSNNNELDSDRLARMVESGDISTDRILFACPQDVDIAPGADFQSAIDEAKLIADRRMVLQQAHLRFGTLSRVSYNSGLDFERYYRDLYEDIQKYHDVWFDKLFNVDNPNPTHAEFTTGILGTLCTILRQRGDLEECAEIMKTYMAVLKRYQQQTEGCGVAAQVDCCEGLTFRANLIRCNLGVQLGDKEMAMTAFHDVVKYEKKEKAAGRYTDDSCPDLDGMLECFFGHRDYDRIDDDDIFNALTFMDKECNKDGPQLKPRECSYYNCDKKEQMSGDFNLCSKCHKQPYCGKECQVRDWKIHKLLCCGKNKTDIEDDTLLMIMELMLKNYGATADARSEIKISSRQKDAASAALLKKLMKLFTGEFSHFNSQQAVGDAGTNPAFSQALADFFAQQPGYDKVWGVLRVGYRESLEREREAVSRSNTLTLNESVIRGACEEMAKRSTLTIGNVMCDGDSSRNLSKHHLLIDALVEETKEFLREHKEYDSYAGLQKVGYNPDYMLIISKVICEVYEVEMDEEGNFTT
eukprot:scaffold8511_cov134-Skeletonema_marinoi.AAC.1